MYECAALLGLYAISPLHHGSGRDVGVIDLPIAREAVTDHPLIHGSAVKGVLRDLVEHSADGKECAKRLFGATDRDGGAGVLGVSDARILLMPVRTMSLGFIWVTCPEVLATLQRAIHALRVSKAVLLQGDPLALQPAEDEVLLPGAPAEDEKVIIEDDLFRLSRRPLNEDTGALTSLGRVVSACQMLAGGKGEDASDYFIGRMKSAIGIVTDEQFRRLTRVATEKVTRNRLEEHSKVVMDGALWTEEVLPREVLLYSLVVAKARGLGERRTEAAAGLQALADLADGVHAQFGADEGIGRGWCRLTAIGGAQ